MYLSIWYMGNKSECGKIPLLQVYVVVHVFFCSVFLSFPLLYRNKFMLRISTDFLNIPLMVPSLCDWQLSKILSCVVLVVNYYRWKITYYETELHVSCHFSLIFLLLACYWFFFIIILLVNNGNFVGDISTNN